MYKDVKHVIRYVLLVRIYYKYVLYVTVVLNNEFLMIFTFHHLKFKRYKI